MKTSKLQNLLIALVLAVGACGAVPSNEPTGKPISVRTILAADKDAAIAQTGIINPVAAPESTTAESEDQMLQSLDQSIVAGFNGIHCTSCGGSSICNNDHLMRCCMYYNGHVVHPCSCERC